MPFYPRFWPERLEQGADFLFSSQWRRYTKSVGVFVCDMSDLFGVGVPEDWTNEVLQVIKDASAHSSHRFYLLTKQPQNLPAWSPFPDNCWVGVTATTEELFKDALFKRGGLSDTEAKIKFISFEPLLDWDQRWYTDNYFRQCGINWVIIGAQSRPTVYPKIEWVRDIVEAADKAGIPVFLKDNLYPLIGLGSGRPSLFHKNDIGELRQEMPA